MNIDKLTLIYFSPTGTTRRILNGIADGMSAQAIEHIDITPPGSEMSPVDALQTDCTIIGAPVYGGRVPLDAINRLKRIRAHGIPAVIVVVYGNRAYDDALLELSTISIECGFSPAACGAFIGEHSFSSGKTPIAAGRPDEKDINTANDFGARVLDKIKAAPSNDVLSPCRAPGNNPFKERLPMHGIAPYARKELCTSCGICAEVCPAGAITVNGKVYADPDTCILCHACVKGCPKRAMAFNAPLIQAISEKLFVVCSERREPEIYL